MISLAGAAAITTISINLLEAKDHFKRVKKVASSVVSGSKKVGIKVKDKLKGK